MAEYDFSGLDDFKNTWERVAKETQDPESQNFVGNVAMGGMGSIEKMGAQKAAEILEKVGTPEIASTLKGAAKDAYLKALDVIHGPSSQRAEKVGFNPETYYHGSTENIKNFDPSKAALDSKDISPANFFTKDPDLANYYAKNSGSVYPSKLSLKNTFDYENPNHLKQIESDLKQSIDKKFAYVAPEEAARRSQRSLGRYMKDIGNGDYSVLQYPEVQEAIKNKGFDSFNVFTGGNKSVGVYGPENIRSTSAAFDPRFKNSSNILSGGAALAAPAVMSSQDQNYASGGEVQYNFSGLDQGESTNAAMPTYDFSGVDQLNEQDQAQEKYGGTDQQIKSFIEGAGTGVAGPLFTAGEKALGVKGENILGREKANPISHGAGQALGFTGSALTGVGEAPLLEALGKGATELTGLAEGASTLSKVASAAVKNAVETGAMTAGDEASRALAGDPTTFESAMPSIGASMLLGGAGGAAFGSVAPIWEATAGPKVRQLMDLINKKATGVEGVIPDVIASDLNSMGAEVVPGEVKGLLSDNPMARELAQELGEAETKSGEAARHSLNTFRDSMEEAALSTAGKTKADLPEINTFSEAKAGDQIKKQIINEVKDRIEPLAKSFEETANKYSGVEIMKTQKDALVDRMSTIANEERWLIDPKSPQAKIFNRVMDVVPNLKTAEDMRKFISNIGKETSGFAADPALKNAAGKLTRSMNDALTDIVSNEVRKDTARLSPEAALEVMAKHDADKEGYKQAIDMAQELGSRLGVKKWYGLKNFTSRIEDLAPEKVLSKFGSKNDSELLDYLSKTHPEIADVVKNYHMNNLLWDSSKGLEDKFSVKKYLDKIRDMSPEMRNSLFSPEAQAKLNAIDRVQAKLAPRMNPSGSATTLARLWKHVPNGAMAMVAWLTGHGPAASIISSVLGPQVIRESEDALKLGLLRYLGNGQHISANGFKSMVGYFDHVIKGESLLANSAKNIFKAGAIVLPEKLTPTDKIKERLDKRVNELKTKPEDLLDIGGTTTVYMPEHGAPMGETAQKITNYLQNLNPSHDKQNPLDEAPIISRPEKDNYSRALEIAEQPLVVMNNIKEGTLTTQDVLHLNSMYPGLYSKMKQKISNEMINAVDKQTEIPYKTKMGLSLFLGQPLDSTLTPQGIQNSQMTFMTQGQPQQQPQKRSHNTDGLAKLSKDYMTPGQAREARHMKG